MKKIGFTFILVLSMMVLVACGEKEEASSQADGVYAKGKHHAEIKIQEYGTIKVELDADSAPITVANFAKLADEKFYDGLRFHRIIPGFMMQGGDPKLVGKEQKPNIKGEFAANGVENKISHKRGTISLARAQDNDSGNSQFFICHQDALYLDGQYAGFGTVTEGMEVVDQICSSVTPMDGNGTIDAKEQPVIESIRMVD